MIKKLRKKFICINMILISIVLLLVFGALVIFQAKRLEVEVTARMGQSLERPFDENFKKTIGKSDKRNLAPADFIPLYTILTDENGSILSHSTTNSSFSLSSDILSSAIEEAFAAQKDNGVLSDFDLRFLKRNVPEGIRIVFVDLGYEISSLRSMLFNYTLTLLLCLIAFFLITLFLARWALHPVEEAWKQQNQFVADASHELKTPLTVILANLNILLSHPDDTIRQQMKWIENTQTESTRMKKLVDNLLFLAKSDAKQIPTNFSNFNLSDAAWSCLLPFESIAFEEKITIIEDISPDLWIYGNEEQLRQVMMILLDNACKYTEPNGTVQFHLSEEQSKITLKVQNSGDVISPEDLEHIFERFYRSDKSRSRKDGGYGLGLSIAQSIVQKHHGKIRVTSSIEEGTVFYVTLFCDKKKMSAVK